MSSTLSLSIAARRPNSIADNTAAHQMLLDELNAEARACGWDGTTIDCYRIHAGIIGLTVVSGSMPATIEDLRQFKDAQQNENAEQNETERLI